MIELAMVAWSEASEEGLSGGEGKVSSISGGISQESETKGDMSDSEHRSSFEHQTYHLGPYLHLRSFLLQ